ncbi:hypothetical protein LSUE1_G005979 [Lachnellula suecica]|uniref:ABM domain-containing protein n=1 Tax=Lachnellula suecica TaxID=602035 RepID=A0A8T9C981_9HELO|nr:hypothetical protein LSUE1_G005979 [Lachnellula suecica]
MSEVHVCAILTPAAGKESRLREMLSDLTVKVKQHESDVPKYQLFEQYDSKTGTNVFVVEEIYKNQAALDAHFKTEYFQELGKAIPAEELLAAPLNIMTIKPIAGFASR